MQGRFVLRNITEADAAVVAKLSCELGYPAEPNTIQNRIATLVSSQSDLLVGALNEANELAGWLQAHAANVLESGFRVEIMGLIVATKFRRCGVGRALVSRAEEWARCLGAPTMVVRSNVSREESHGFYPALGYTVNKTQTVYRKSLSDAAR